MKTKIVAGLLLLTMLLSCFVACGEAKPNETSDGTVKGNTAMSTEHYNVTKGMFRVYYTENFYSFYNQYASYITYLFDPTKPLSSQNYSDGYASAVLGETYTGTWQDYFTDKGIEYAKRILRFCEAALAEGMEPNEEDDAVAQSYCDQLKAGAEKAGQTYTEYINGLYGGFTTDADIYAASRLSSFAGRYQTAVSNRITSAVKDDEVSAYYAANLSTYETADFYRYILYRKKTGDSEADKAEIEAMVEEAKKFEQASGLDEFIQVMKDEIRPEAVKEAKAQYYDTFYKSFSETYSGEELEMKINEKLAQTAETLISSAVSDMLFTKQTYEDVAGLTPDFANWLFGKETGEADDPKEGAKPGDVITVVSEDDMSEDDPCYYIVAICIKSVPKKDLNQLYRVAYVLFDDNETGKAAAEDVYRKFLATESKSTAVLTEMGEQAEATLAKSVNTYYAGAFGVTAIDEWFAAAKPGDVGMVTAVMANGKSFCTVLYLSDFVGEGWFLTARSDLVKARSDEWHLLHAGTVLVTVYDAVCRVF